MKTETYFPILDDKISLPITPALIIVHEILVPSEAESSNGLSLKLISLRG